MKKCKYLPQNCDEVAECRSYLTNLEMLLLLDNLSRECHVFAEKLMSFLDTYPDLNYSAYFYRNYRRLMKDIHTASRELRIKNTGEDVLVSDIFGS